MTRYSAWGVGVLHLLFSFSTRLNGLGLVEADLPPQCADVTLGSIVTGYGSLERVLQTSRKLSAMANRLYWSQRDEGFHAHSFYLVSAILGHLQSLSDRGRQGSLLVRQALWGSGQNRHGLFDR